MPIISSPSPPASTFEWDEPAHSSPYTISANFLFSSSGTSFQPAVVLAPVIDLHTIVVTSEDSTDNDDNDSFMTVTLT